METPVVSLSDQDLPGATHFTAFRHSHCGPENVGRGLVAGDNHFVKEVEEFLLGFKRHPWDNLFANI